VNQTDYLTLLLPKYGRSNEKGATGPISASVFEMPESAHWAIFLGSGIRASAKSHGAERTLKRHWTHPDGLGIWEEVLFMKVNSLLDCVAETAAVALAQLWPAFGNNAATESNIRSALTIVTAAMGFTCYSEFPIRYSGGSIHLDYAAIRMMPFPPVDVVVETKTDGADDKKIQEWIADYVRIQGLDLSLAEHKYISLENSEKLRLSLFWTDNPDKQRRIHEAFKPQPEGLVSVSSAFGVSLPPSNAVLCTTDVGWGLRLFMLSNRLEFGRSDIG